MGDPGLQLPHPPLDGRLHLQDIRLADGLLDGLEVLLQESSGCRQGHVLYLLGRRPGVGRISIRDSGETNISGEYLYTVFIMVFELLLHQVCLTSSFSDSIIRG